MSRKRICLKSALMVIPIILFTILSGCLNSPENFVVVPANDITPPAASISISERNSDNIISVNETSQPVTINAGSDEVTIISGATDMDGGIKEVDLYLTITYYYGPGKVAGPGLVSGPVKKDVSNASVGERTAKHRFLIYNVDLKKYNEGSTSIKVEVWTEGENFHGGKTATPIVSIYYPR